MTTRTKPKSSSKNIQKMLPVQTTAIRRPVNASIVMSLIEPTSTVSRASNCSPSRLMALLQDGLAVKELDDLRMALDISMAELGEYLGISKATLHRRKSEKSLTSAESDHVLRYARLMGIAVEVMESKEAARLWLKSPQAGLAGEIPLRYAQTEVGAREVELLLGRIEHGVYS